MKNIRIELKWAVIFILMGLSWMILEKLVGLHSTHIDKHAIYTNLVAIPAILIYYLALRDKRDNFYDGYMSYGKGFFAGSIMTLFIAILSPFSQYITFTFIAPEYFSNKTDFVVDKGIMSREAAEILYNLNSTIWQGLIFSLFMGIVITAVVTLFVYRNKPTTLEEAS
jgi:hypothetical protein